MHVTVHLPLDLLSSCLFVHEPEDLLVCPERAGRLDAGKPPPTLPLTLIQHPFEEGLEGTARDGLHYPGRILLYILAVLVKRVRLADSIAGDGRQEENGVPTDGNFPRSYPGGGDCHRCSPHLHPRIRRSCSLGRGSTLVGGHSPL
jgi:hypothetical protein